MTAILRFLVVAAGYCLEKEPDKGVMEVFNDYNADLINLYRCVKTGHGSFCRCWGFAAEQPG